MAKAPRSVIRQSEIDVTTHPRGESTSAQSRDQFDVQVLLAKETLLQCNRDGNVKGCGARIGDIYYG
ncbi:MAG TPA: hypothetical protein VK603_24080 [Candidatus Saccharimonadales bacterium]|nr:hypothetical protein [Candidatus Saccharimonadales bacterium]